MKNFTVTLRIEAPNIETVEWMVESMIHGGGLLDVIIDEDTTDDTEPGGISR